MKTMLSILFICIATFSPAAETTSFTEACASIEDGAKLRLVLVDGTRVPCAAAGWDGTQLHCIFDDESAGTICAPEVTEIWLRGHGGAKGAISGGILGGLLGGAVGGFAVGLGSLGENGPQGSELAGVLIGAAGGGFVMAVVGGSIGSFFPDWKRIYVREGHEPDPPQDSPGGEHRDLVSGMRLAYGPIWNPGALEDENKAGWRMGFTTYSSPRTELAVELGHYVTGPPDMDYHQYDEPTDQTVWHTGVVGRYYVLTGWLRPYFTAGTGYYDWQDKFWGGSYGTGLAVSGGNNLLFHAEYRHHATLIKQDGSDPRFGTLMVGTTISW